MRAMWRGLGRWIGRCGLTTRRHRGVYGESFFSSSLLFFLGPGGGKVGYGLIVGRCGLYGGIVLMVFGAFRDFYADLEGKKET